MQAKAKLQVLDEPVRPVDATGLTAQTGLTGHETGLTAQTTGDSSSGMKDDVVTKSRRQIWRVPIISYLKILITVQRRIFGVWNSDMF